MDHRNDEYKHHDSIHRGLDRDPKNHMPEESVTVEARSPHGGPEEKVNGKPGETREALKGTSRDDARTVHHAYLDSLTLVHE